MVKKKTINKKKLSRDCWSLDDSFYLWLQERLPVYLKEAGKIVDLNYHKFEFEGNQYTQEELIKMLIKDVDFLVEEDRFHPDYAITRDRAMGIWSLILPSMWW